MYGHLNLIIQKFVSAQFGEDVWKTVVKKCKCPASFEQERQYQDDTTQKLLETVSQITGLKRYVFLSMLGEHYLEHIRHLGHDELLRNLGENLLAFVENLDYVHTYMMSDFPEMKMPSFKCEADSKEDQITLHYYSFRLGYYPMVMGILKAVSKTYFKTAITIEVLSKSIEEVDKKSAREHVVFSISPVKVPVNDHQAPPTLVAQTKKAGERQILKNDVEHVVSRLEEIKKTQGEAALPLNKAKVAKAKWQSLARVSMLRGGFLPDFPDKISLNGRAFCNGFPYHVLFDGGMQVVHAGTKLQQIMTGLKTKGSRVDLFFDLLHPNAMAFTSDNIKKFINTPFVLQARATKMGKERKSCPPLILRGQMLYLEDKDLLLYICSPFVRSLRNLEERMLHLADIPIHDVTRDLLWMELMNRHKPDTSLSKGTGRHYQNSAFGAPILTGHTPNALLRKPFSPGGQGNHDLSDLERELLQTRAELKAERRRNQQLYHAFLPLPIAEQMLAGRKPDAGEYANVSVLFCDIVAFTHIIARCKASDVVNLLTQLHRKFDQVCRLHATHRVEAIGDAYLVLCGAPHPVADHAEKIANTALGMKELAKDVHSPFDYGDRSQNVKIRIGLHCGSVVSGVVGERLPKYLVMGDTINMASKLESHGVPDQIQASAQIYELLKKKAYRFERRGTIEMRGKGKVVTYILVANEQLRIEELTGQKPGAHDTVEVTFINEGKEEHPPMSSSTSRSVSPLLPSNKVKPADDVLVPGHAVSRK